MSITETEHAVVTLLEVNCVDGGFTSFEGVKKRSEIHKLHAGYSGSCCLIVGSSYFDKQLGRFDGPIESEC